MPNNEKPRRRRKPTRDRKIRVPEPGWVRITNRGKLVFISDRETAGVANLRFDPPQGQTSE